jgi:hypothetical protein
VRIKLKTRFVVTKIPENAVAGLLAASAIRQGRLEMEKTAVDGGYQIAVDVGGDFTRPQLQALVNAIGAFEPYVTAPILCDATVTHDPQPEGTPR